MDFLTKNRETKIYNGRVYFQKGLNQVAVLFKKVILRFVLNLC